MTKKKALVIFSYHDYGDEGALFKQHVALLNDVQGNEPQVTFHYGALCNMVFVYDGRQLRVHVPGTGNDVTDYDFVFFQRWMRLPQHALALATRLKQAGVPFMSKQVGQQVAMSKLAELAMFAKAGIPVPKTVVAPMHELRRLAEEDQLPFTYPFVLKDIDASMGTSNFLIRTFDDLKNKQDRAQASSFMAQEFIPNDCDYRFVIAHGEILYVLRRTRAANSHLNNTSQGGSGAFVAVSEFSAAVIGTVMQAAKAVGRSDYAGVDVIVTQDGEACVLEVNRSPAIQTGHDANYKTKLLVNHITKQLKG